MDRQFLVDVMQGLSSSPKFLSSKYLYDKNGDRLFREIMDMEEYYLTRSELEIFTSNKEAILEHFSGSCESFRMVEFGPGDARKTKVLIEHFLKKNVLFEYNPIDISGNAIRMLSEDLAGTFPALQMAPVNLEYFDALDRIRKKDACKKAILFLGSNIGNFSSDQALDFFSTLAGKMSGEDQLLIGFDLKKDPAVILAAYNDRKGITRDFNLNLLHRINRELGSDLNPDDFYHFPVYDPLEGAARSYLVSRLAHQVTIGSIPLKIRFEKGEPVFMEVSWKYSMGDINGFAEKSGFRVVENFFDKKRYFVNSLWELG